VAGSAARCIAQDDARERVPGIGPPPDGPDDDAGQDEERPRGADHERGGEVLQLVVYPKPPGEDGEAEESDRDEASQDLESGE
jgi:hypothetical protein